MTNTEIVEVGTMDEKTLLAMYQQRFAEEGPAAGTSSADNLGRVRILRDNAEDANGDIIAPSGHFAVTSNGETYYAKTVSFRYFDHRHRYKRYDADVERKNRDGTTSRGSYIHSVLVQGQRDEAPSEDGSFQCGRSLEFIKDWSSLSKDRQEFIKSCRIMTIYFGEVRVIGKSKSGEDCDVVIPVEMELSGKTSGKTLAKFYHDVVTKYRTVPNFVDVELKAKKISGGVTYYDIEPSLTGDPVHKMDDAAVALFSKFGDHIRQINKWIMEKHDSNVGQPAQSSSMDDFVDVE
jgi:hypothetical protein